MPYQVGQSANITKTITETDVYLFAGITGDLNPAHLNETYASGTRFQHRIAHGMLSAGLISAVLGTQLPGPGSIYMNQTLRFLTPVYFGDTLTATVTVKELIPEKNRAVLATEVVNQNGAVVTTGEALMLLPM
ncbi:MAG: MaoC family dehydratase [Dysosmobacter sp.]|nr:MaoC family dehydratase [Dysosmobacter sp.]